MKISNIFYLLTCIAVSVSLHGSMSVSAICSQSSEEFKEVFKAEIAKTNQNPHCAISTFAQNPHEFKKAEREFKLREQQNNAAIYQALESTRKILEERRKAALVK